MTEPAFDWLRPRSEDEDDWIRRGDSPVQQVDFAIHTHYLRAYLSPGMRVLEVGAGGGRFTREIAGITGRVVVADLSPEKIQLNQRQATATGYADAVEGWIEADMTDLSPHFADGEFDAVVCYGGPLSYVFDRRGQALRELVRVTRHGGLLLLSARSLWGTLQQELPRIIRVDPRINREIVRSGDLGPDKVGAASRFWHAFRASEFHEFIQEAGTTVELLSASNCLSSTWGDMVAGWQEDPRSWEHLIELEIEASREPGCADMGTHVIAVARKA